VDIGDDLYKVLENFESKKGTGLHWYCATCYVGIKKVLVDMLGLMENQKVVVSDIEGLKKRMDEFGIKKDTAQVKQDIEILRKELDEIKKENTVLKREGEETKDMVKQIKKEAVIKKEVDDMSAAVVGVRKENEDLRKLWTEVVESKGQVNERKEVGERNTNNVTEIVDHRVAEKLKEEEDKKSRKDKLLIFGLEEDRGVDTQARDIIKAKDILRYLKHDDEVLVRTIRIGKHRETGSRPLLVTVKDEATKWQIIGRAKALRDDESWKSVYITLDLTKIERKHELELKANLKAKREESSKNGDGRRWTIKKGVVIEKKSPVTEMGEQSSH